MALSTYISSFQRLAGNIAMKRCSTFDILPANRMFAKDFTRRSKNSFANASSCAPTNDGYTSQEASSRVLYRQRSVQTVEKSTHTTCGYFFGARCHTARNGHATTWATGPSILSSLSTPQQKLSHRCFSTRNIRGRLFYRRRPKMIPRYKPKNRRSCWLEGCPQKKGVCVTIRVVTPRKPNSGLRKVARVRLSTGRTVTCHIPGEGHNLHTHSVVLVRGGRCQDVSGCHYKVIRGKYDLLPVKNRVSSRSKYGVRLTDAIIEKRRLKMNRLHVTTELDREVFNQLLLHDWINPDGTRRTEPVGPDEAVPMDIFAFNSRLRSVVHSSSK